MAKNFIILFTAREGSTAIVDALSRHPDISVPILEELDKFWIKHFYDDIDVVREIDSIFSCNDFRLGDDWAFRNYVSDNKRGKDVASIGFKWRPHGKIAQVARMMQKRNVVLFVLFRSDFDELCASLYVGQTLAAGDDGSQHTQFRFARMSDEEKTAFREELEGQVVYARFRPIFYIMVRRVLRALQLRLIAGKLCRSGIHVRALYYEDFLQSPDRFFAKICHELQIASVGAESLIKGQKMQKTTRIPATKRISGFSRIQKNPLSKLMRLTYTWTISRIKPAGS
ncbi:hypothetical protein J7394_21335 [Ruegeria sp. R13_0]|uniref:hypothetical protein n=1 Tax=Ruegeria sp. R13_0 TaxID=2821099 RepID=UPI001ADB5DAB|nr:hypothetical protein [Ruegeria sp. R13_0]MBO9436760.1 hypothetical protein [Ruegeria sp. R13_0]